MTLAFKIERKYELVGFTFAQLLHLRLFPLEELSHEEFFIHAEEADIVRSDGLFTHRVQDSVGGVGLEARHHGQGKAHVFNELLVLAESEEQVLQSELR